MAVTAVFVDFIAAAKTIAPQNTVAVAASVVAVAPYLTAIDVKAAAVAITPNTAAVAAETVVVVVVPKAAEIVIVTAAVVGALKAAAEGAVLRQSPDGSGEFVEGER